MKSIKARAAASKYRVQRITALDMLVTVWFRFTLCRLLDDSSKRIKLDQTKPVLDIVTEICQHMEISHPVSNTTLAFTLACTSVVACCFFLLEQNA